MKSSFFCLILLVNISLTASSQNHISTYNGKKWEQLQGSGKLLTINPAVTAFNSIEINNLNVKVKIETGAESCTMLVSIDDNLKDFFRWEVVEGILKISFDMNGGKYPRWLSENNTVIIITAPAIEKLVNKSNSDLEISLQNQNNLNLFTDGNPDIKITGKIALLNLQSTGNAEIKAAELDVEKIIISSNGNADIEVKTKDLVEKEIKGNNDIINLFYSTKKIKKQDYNNWDSENSDLISFRFKNKSSIAAKVTLISYRPDKSGNGTNSFTLIPFGTKTLKFPEGTKIYLASKAQVRTVMSGAKISDQVPFLIVKKQDADKVFNIN
jgi:Putative auto-transporter adhesin, head GIN domain